MLANPPLCHCPLALWRPSGGPVDQREYDREIVLNVMGYVEGMLNVMSNAVVAATTTSETNRIEDQENIQIHKILKKLHPHQKKNYNKQSIHINF